MQRFRSPLWVGILFLGTAAAALAQNAALRDDQALFNEGQQRLRAGQAGMAKVTFETLIAVYPHSPLAAQARDALRAAEAQEPRAPVVRAIRFENCKKLKSAILQRFNEREVGLTVDAPLDLRALEDARKTMQQLLAEEGQANRAVLVATREISLAFVDVTFRVVKE